jgi:peptidoglycan/LPS O-acetylase OafA/YrhL
MEPHARRGGFDTVRLLAALTVFHSHSFALAGLTEPRVPGFTWGSAAVIVFFAISGYWIRRSALERSLASFAVARALRIAPGLFVCCLVTIGLCALATSEVVDDYFRNPATWSWLRNALPFFLPQQPLLPGVFEDGAYHHADGSLWTLPHEVFCYLLAGSAALFGRKGLQLAGAGAAIYAAVVLLDPQAGGMLQFTSQLDRRWLAIFLAAFFLGGALNEASERSLACLVAVSALALLLTRHDPSLVAISAVGLFGGLAIWAGRTLDLDRVVTRGRDISYGVYIYAFPVEQLAARALPPHDLASYLAYYAAALAATLLLAILSWRLVETPALAAKAPVAAAAERALARLPRAGLRLRPEA